MTSLIKRRIEARLGDRVRRSIDGLDVFAEIDSTNSYLLRQRPPNAGNFAAAIAEHQTLGRGRHDRAWVSAPGASLCLSISYAFRRAPSDLPPLTLALGLGIAGRLTANLAVPVAIKWPNDLLADGRKLGGVLTEVHTDAGRTAVVAGVGINTAAHDGLAGVAREHGAPLPTDLASLLSAPPSGEQLAALLIDAMFDTFAAYDDTGFDDFRAAFDDLDWLSGKRVGIDAPNGEIRGVASGIDANGRLRVDTGDDVAHVVSGSVRVLDAGAIR